MAIIRFRNPNGNSYYDTDGAQYDNAARRGSSRAAYDFDEENEDGGAGLSRNRSVLRALLIAGVAAILIFIIRAELQGRVYSGASYNKIADVISQEGARYIALGDAVVTCSRDGASCMDTGGKMIWNIPFEMQQPVIDVSGQVLAVCDLGGSTIYILNSRQELGRVNTNLPVRAIRVSESGEVAAVLEDTDITWIYLYDQNGETIAYFKTTMAQSGYPVSMAISPDGEVVGVAHLTMGNSSIGSSIAFYNFGSVGQNSVENNVSGYNYSDEIFPYFTYLGNGSCAAVSDSRIVFFKGEEIPQSAANAMFSAQLEGVYSDGKHIALLFPDTSGEEDHSLRIYNDEGQLVVTIPFTLDFTNIQLVGDRVVINSDQECLIYNLSGVRKYRGTFRDDVIAVIPSQSPGKLTIVTKTTIEQMILE